MFSRVEESDGFFSWSIILFRFVICDSRNFDREDRFSFPIVNNHDRGMMNI